jgi:beta-glucosidase
MTDLDWEIYPDGLHNTLVAVYYSYRPKKLYIAENGACYIDAPNADGFTDDQRRIAYLDGHLRAIHRAIQAGVPLAGYYVWSLMDNFEWSNGFSKPFGLVATNYTTQERLPRASAYWYGQVAQRNGLEL